MPSSPQGPSGVEAQTMKTTTKITANPAALPTGERMQLEDQIMERALALWRKKGRAHLNAPDALLQAEREILAQNGTARVRS